MKGLDYHRRIREELEELRLLLRKQERSLAKRRLRFLILLKSGECTSQASAGAQIGIKRRAAEKLWKLYHTKGIEGLLEKPHSGRPAKLDEAAKQALQNELDGSRIQTLGQACDLVRQNHDISISPVAMHYYFKAQKIKKKTGRPTNVRPTNVRKDVEGEKAFKKKSFPL